MADFSSLAGTSTETCVHLAKELALLQGVSEDRMSLTETSTEPCVHLKEKLALLQKVDKERLSNANLKLRENLEFQKSCPESFSAVSTSDAGEEIESENSSDTLRVEESSTEIGDGETDAVPCSSSTALNCIQQAIAVSLKKLPHRPKRDLLMTDFSEIEVISFGKNGANSSETNFNLLAYAPVAFRYFRDIFGITTEDFMRSICGASLVDVTNRTRSSSKIYTTFDDCFFLKVISKKEIDFLLNLFPGYFLNLTQHPKTLLPKFYGLFRYQKVTRNVSLLITNNILPTHVPFLEKYDLKGSTYCKRKTKPKSADGHGMIPHTRKDLDFLDRWPEGFYLKQKSYDHLMQSIERDCLVLQSYSIMDYSLLLGISRPHKKKCTSCTRLLRDDGIKTLPMSIGPFKARDMKGETFYLYVGIIDILQTYRLSKKLEYHLKSIVYSKGTISVNRPKFLLEKVSRIFARKCFQVHSTVAFQSS